MKRELHSDGTTSVMNHELKNKSFEENLNPEENTIQEKINASNFLNKLKKTNAVTNESINKREGTENESPKAKRVKKSKNSSKSLANYLEKHYNTNDSEDYETVFNTSINKYGRELVPRDERPEITQLFNDQNNEMDITKVCISSQELNKTNTAIDISMKENSEKMSVNMTQSQTQILNTTKYFTNNEMSMTVTFDCNPNQSLEDQNDISIDCNHNKSFFEGQKEISFNDSDINNSCAEEQNDMSMTLAFDSNINKSYIKDQNEMSMTLAIDSKIEKSCIEDQNEMSMTLAIDSNINNSCIKDQNEISIDCNHNKSFFKDQKEISLNDSDINNSCAEEQNDMSMTLAIDSNINKSCIKDQNEMSMTLAIDSKIEKSYIEDQNEISIDCNHNKSFFKEQKEISMTESIDSNINKSCIEEQNDMSLTLTTNSKFNKSCVEDFRRDVDQEMSITATFDININKSGAEEQNDMSITATIDSNINKSCVEVQNEVSMTATINCNQNKSCVEEQKVNISKPLIEKNVLPFIKLPNKLFTDMNQTKKVCAPRLSMGWLAQTTAQTIPQSPNTHTSRLELTKSLVKDTFGFGITEKLKQKRVEFEAKRRQSNANVLIPNSLNTTIPSEAQNVFYSNEKSITNAFDPKDKSVTNVFDPKDKSIINAFDPKDKSVTNAFDPKDKSITNAFDPKDKSITNAFDPKDKSITNAFDPKDKSVTNAFDPKEKSITNAFDSSVKSITNAFDSNEKSISDALNLSNKSITSDKTSDVTFEETINETMAESMEMSSPSFDETFHFSFNPIDSPSDSFDPFIHTDHSFNANSSFYNSTSPLQFSFIVKDDTLCLLSDQLERELNNIEIPKETPQKPINSSAVFIPLANIDTKQNELTVEMLNDEKLLISYLWGTFALEIKFGKTIDNDICPSFPVKEITAINMKSLVSAEEPLHMRQQELLFQFNENHKPLLTIAHDLIISSFESEKKQILNKYKTTSSLEELISEISVKVLTAKKLLSELRIITSAQVCKLYPKQNECYRY